MEIFTRKGERVIVDTEDYDELAGYTWRLRKFIRGDAYVVRTQKRKPGMVFMHRQIMGLILAGREVHIDHINGDTLDNRRCNLRIVTPSQNNQNRHRGWGSSSYKGVTWNSDRGKWQAQIKLDGKNFYLGLYREEAQAAHAYDVAAVEMFGDYANVNFASQIGAQE